jgi:hypothetical protein
MAPFDEVKGGTSLNELSSTEKRQYTNDLRSLKQSNQQLNYNNDNNIKQVAENTGQSSLVSGSPGQQVAMNTNAGSKVINSVSTRDSASNSYGGGLVRIGMPMRYRPQVDPNNWLSDYYTKKMTVIDMIPCAFTFDIFDMANSGKLAGAGVEGFLPKIQYKVAIDNFKKKCAHYGLPKSDYYGLKLFATDETTASDNIVNSYETNLVEGAINRMLQGSRSIRDILKSFGQQGQQLGVDAVNYASTKVGQGARAGAGLISPVTGFSEGTNARIGDIAEHATKIIGNMAINGTQISFPKVWSSSAYSPNISVNLKLFSPYGHPDAIQQAIIRPLMYLILLAAPETTDGITYGNPPFVSIRAHGLNHINIGAITSITLRRGGSDTSFNIYRQPLTVDVSIDFQNIVDGFSVVNPDNNKMAYDKNIYNSVSVQGSKQPPSPVTIVMPTLGDIVRSMMPYDDSPEASLQPIESPTNNPITPANRPRAEADSASGAIADAAKNTFNVEKKLAEGNDNKPSESKPNTTQNSSEVAGTKQPTAPNPLENSVPDTPSTSSTSVASKDIGPSPMLTDGSVPLA